MIDAEDILAKLEAKQETKIAALSPEQRKDLDCRQAARAKRILEEARKKDPDLLRLEAALDGAFVIEKLATENPDAFRKSLENILGEYTQEEIDAFLSKWRNALYAHLDEKDDDLADIATAEARRQGVESAANLRGILGEIMGMKAQGDRIEKTAVETRQGVGVLVSKLPDAKKPTVISWAEATEIFMPGVFTKRGDQFVRTDKTRKKAVDSFRRNCSNWIKAGYAGRSKLPIAWDNLATTNTWKKWVEAYAIAERKATEVSERAGKVEAEKSRRRSPTA